MAKKVTNYKYGEHYKHRDIKIFSSPEWMADSTRKYRRVFEKGEIGYMRFEFSFYNKLFDEEEWETKATIKAFNITDGKKDQICSLDSNFTVKTDENIVYVNESWGVDKEGGFWKKGDYICEAYLDDKLVGSQVFYIHDNGVVTTAYNPYFDVLSFRMFEGERYAVDLSKRRYLKKFKKDTARYIWFELAFKNKLKTGWWFEYYVNVYDDAGQPKAHMVNMKYIDKGTKDYTYTFEKGWGTDEGGSWKNNKYFVEIVFMDKLIAALPFECGDSEEEGTPELSSSTSHLTGIQQQVKEVIETEESLEDVVKKLDELIGLQDVKKKIKDHINFLDFMKLRKEKGFDDNESISLHSVFTGNPGTGKTTVVKLLGKIYQKMGLLSKGHVHEVDRADLVGEYIGQTAPKVKDAIKEARGGILFIDEAYALYRAQDDAKDFGKEVIEIIVKEMSDGAGDIAIMVAGYPKEMDTFLNSNPGLKSRFKHYFHFEDYLPEELLAISDYACIKRNIILKPEARTLIEKVLVEAYRNRDRSFGNARFAYAIIDEGKMNMGLRLMTRKDVKSLSKEELSTIEEADIEKIIATKHKKLLDIAIEEQLLRESLKELNALVGLQNIKTEVNELVKLVRYYRESGKDVLNKFSLHTVFTGNPGTGKTTVARIMGKIYKALGLLERGHVVETGRDGLVAGYIGQTAIKTKAKLDEAMGGVLFIDEAYGLSDGGQNSYGKEAIEVILKNMEDYRGKIAVIVAGYPENMDNFLRMNPGLMSRFDRTLHFTDYTPETLYDIALYMLSKENLTPDAEAEVYMKKHLGDLFDARDKFFGNAREIRKMVEKIIKNQNLRMASIDGSIRTKEMMETVAIDDVKEFVYVKPKGASIGFKQN